MNRVKELRLEKRMTQLQLSMAANVSQQEISRLENGGSMSENVLLTMASYFNVTTDYLLGISPIRGPEECKIRGEYKTFFEKYGRLDEENRETLMMLADRLLEIQRNR